MNIIEAAKSGKRFRRVGMATNAWYEFRAGSLLYIHDDYAAEASLMREDFLAESWEIDEKKILLTRSGLIHAAIRCLQKNPATPHGIPDALDIAKELGLE